MLLSINGSNHFSSILQDISPLQSDHPCLPTTKRSALWAAEPHFPLPWPKPYTLIQSHHINAGTGQPRYRWLCTLSTTFWEGSATHGARSLAEMGDGSVLSKSCKFFW